eukprot:GHVR01152607.1.p1 GENE.GHVR01152607.1~~GHVR01152607.1.p1  ORF type:complete len:264 (+),score=88.85 GHVR01152607.1:28-819(+)
MGDDLDDVFGDFLNEVESIPITTQRKRPVRSKTSDGAVIKLGSASDQVFRLTNKVFTNSYEVLLLTPDAGDEDIKKMYKKMSLMLHPDKCRVDNANLAFQVVMKAYEELQLPHNKKKYESVIKEAKARVEHKRKIENAKREKAKKPLLGDDDGEINTQVMQECDEMLHEMEERKKYTEGVLSANQKREEALEADEVLKEQERELLEKKRTATMGDRVEGWREFQTNKRHRVRIEHKREERMTVDKSVSKKPLGVDQSYKLNWR